MKFNLSRSGLQQKKFLFFILKTKSRKKVPGSFYSKKKMKRLSVKKILKTQISSRMGEFISPEAIQLKAKFAKQI